MNVDGRARAFVEILGPLIGGHPYHGASHLERGDVLALAYGEARVHPSPSHRYEKKRQRDAARALAERCPLGPSAHVRVYQEAEFLHGTDHVLAALVAEAGEAAIALYEVTSGWTGVFRVGEVARVAAPSDAAPVQSTDTVVALSKIARGVASAVRVRAKELPPRPVAIPTAPAITAVTDDGVLVGALADALGLSARNEFGAPSWTSRMGGSAPEAMFATSPLPIVGWLATLSPRIDGKPGDPCPRCGGTLEDPLRDDIQGGHPVGGDADYVGSGPVELCCSRCGVKLATRLRRTQYFDGSPTTYD